MKNLPDWAIRALKTFVQAFLGVLIPEVVAVLNGAIALGDHVAVKAVLVAAVCSALAAAISAAWNIVNEALAAK